MMNEPLRILLLEDSPIDANLNELLLRKAGIDFTSLRVETRAAFVAALDEFRPDLILADYNLPEFNGLQALSIVMERSPDIPYIFVTGAMGEEQAVKTIKLGASDYILKSNLVRLPAAVQLALEKREAKRQYRETEEKFRKIGESAQDAIIMMTDKRISFWNAAAERIFDYTAAEAMGQELHALITPAAAYARFSQAFPHFQETGEGPIVGKIRELTALRKGGEEFPVELSVSAMQLNGQWHAIGIVRDITERKQAEAAIQHANRALATLGAVNRTLVHATDENELLQAICDAIVKQKGYLMVWVGYKQYDESKSIKTMARAIRSGATQVCQDIANDPLFLPWRDAALQRGYAASITLPLLNEDSTVFGILHVYSGKVNDFTPGEVALLEEMAGDLAFGVRSMHVRQERDLALAKNREHLVQLQDSLEDTVQAMAGLVEMRDPYTAGHQVRVADLAAAIAKQMAFPKEQIHAIHLAGMVHDLGKIKIPAEILSKPGKITDLEFGLIKTHAQAGYDILKDINFPWPIAQMVLQHHERLDGSGYPQGLKGDAILLEARILAVADVVEAMSSHRPYRPGLGIEVALAEITRLRGIHFDPQVVDACLCVIRDKGFVFK